MNMQKNNTDTAICDNTHALLWEYNCGTLCEAGRLLIESYLELKPQAWSILHSFEAISGAYMNTECNPVAMAQDGLTKTLARLDQSLTEAALETLETPHSNEKFLSQTGHLPAPIADHIKSCGTRTKWKKFFPGMSFCTLETKNSHYTATLLKVAPGVKTPEHSHHGTEITLVIQGAFYDEIGEYQAGDLIVADDDVHHQPVAKDGEDCLCLIIADAPIHFTGRFTRFINLLNK